MVRVIAVLEQGYSIHEDGWTETLAGLSLLVKQIEQFEKSGDNFNAVYLLRLAIISSCYLAEQMFSKSVSVYVEKALQECARQSTDQRGYRLLENWSRRNTLRKVGISRAMEEWPEILTGAKFNLGEGALQALTVLTEKRNDIVHKLNDLTQYSQLTLVTKKAIFTAVESCKEIEKHFFPEKEFSYKNWLDKYPVANTGFFNLKITP